MINESGEKKFMETIRKKHLLDYFLEETFGLAGWFDFVSLLVLAVEKL